MHYWFALQMVVMIVGLLMYALAGANAKIEALGRIMFAVGLFWVVGDYGHEWTARIVR